MKFRIDQNTQGYTLYKVEDSLRTWHPPINLGEFSSQEEALSAAQRIVNTIDPITSEIFELHPEPVVQQPRYRGGRW